MVMEVESGKSTDCTFVDGSAIREGVQIEDTQSMFENGCGCTCEECKSCK